MKKGFTLVELIIVIAVIGVLAAILIPTFANVIEKANKKSAFSDAKNALSIFVAEMSDGTGAAVVGEGSVFVAYKAKKFYSFTYAGNGLTEAGNGVPTLPTAPSGSTKTYVAENTVTGATGSTVANFPKTVVLYNVEG